jgi:uracil-DNA glycosylase family 4
MKNQLLAHLQYLKSIGVEYLPELQIDKDNQSRIGNNAEENNTMSTSSATSLESLWKNEVDGCTKCKLAECGRTNIVFGQGNPDADLMFIGEGPGRDEDLQGLPFVGRAGKLLNDIIKAMGMKREDVYIANIVKCRPPNNRNPESDEVKSCIPYLHRQIELIEPKVICSLGSISAHTLLEENTPISKMRGNWYEYRGVPLMPTFHPAYLLRNYNKETRAKVWEDMQKIMARLGGSAPDER